MTSGKDKQDSLTTAPPLTDAVPLDFLDTSGALFLVVGPEGRVPRASTALLEASSGVSGPGEELLTGLLGEVAADQLLRHADRSRRSNRPASPGVWSFDFTNAPWSQCRVFLQPLAGTGGEADVLVLLRPEPEISAERRQFERILNSMPDGVFIIGRDKRVRFFNEACGRITGRSPEEIVSHGCACNDVINCHTEDGLSYAHSLCPARSVFNGEAGYQREEMLVTNSAGEERWVETSYSPVPSPEGGIDYVIGVVRDVHERKMLEERLHQTEKLASLGQLVAGIAHEIKNPLGIIMSSLDVLENRKRPAEQRREAGRFIREEIRRLDDRLRSFLAFARPRELQPTPVALSGLLRRRAASMESLYPELTLEVDIPGPEPILYADEEQLNQVVTNLVMNAGEAMDGGGRVMLRARQQGGTAVVEVEDEGPGVPEEFRSRVFDPFFTTKADGTGLGLSICYQIVLAHGGTLSIGRGRSGRGACFTVRLPITRRFEESDTGT